MNTTTIGTAERWDRTDDDAAYWAWRREMERREVTIGRVLRVDKALRLERVMHRADVRVAAGMDPVKAAELLRDELESQMIAYGWAGRRRTLATRLLRERPSLAS